MFGTYLDGRHLTVPIVVFMLMLAAFFAFPHGVSLARAEEAKKAPVDLITAIGDVARRTIPAVVHIEVRERQEIPAPLSNDPSSRRFFQIPKNQKKVERELVGLGTGMIMDPRGHILTNGHVVEGASKIRVTLANGTVYSDSAVETVGTDAKTDLAVISVKADKPLPFVTFGDSDKADVGEWVVAIGHPRGLNQSVTQGIISAKHRREITDPSSYEDFLQTDAAINPGNSGGPLLNLYGEVIGINAIIASTSGGFEGIGFAIPSNMAVRIARELIDHGRVVRGWIGVSVEDLSPEMAKSLGLNTTEGVLVAEVAQGGPAERAGIAGGDVVTAFQGKDVTDSSTLRNDVATAPVGVDAGITIWRSGAAQELTVKVGDQEEESRILEASLQERLGISVRRVTANEASKYGLEYDRGVVVTRVDPKGPLGRTRVKVGNMILGVDDQAIDGMEDLAATIGAARHLQRVRLLILDQKKAQFAYVTVRVR